MSCFHLHSIVLYFWGQCPFAWVHQDEWIREHMHMFWVLSASEVVLGGEEVLSVQNPRVVDQFQ